MDLIFSIRKVHLSRSHLLLEESQRKVHSRLDAATIHVDYYTLEGTFEFIYPTSGTCSISLEVRHCLLKAGFYRLNLQIKADCREGVCGATRRTKERLSFCLKNPA